MIRIAHLVGQERRIANSIRDENWKPRHELRVPLSMSRIYSALPVDDRMASVLFREEPDDEEDGDEKKDNEEEEEAEEEGYSE
jgi:hypothetical protein